jgi:hypothetical protein
MVFLRRFLSFILSLVALSLVILFLALWSVRFWAIQCEVSQVFKLSHSTTLGPGTYFGSYNVAVTPLVGPDKMAKICQLYTLTPGSYVNLLDKKVWLFPIQEYLFVYDETPQARHWAFVPLGLGFFLLFIAFLLFKERTDPKT